MSRPRRAWTLSQEIEALQEGETFWPVETLAVAGAVVCIDDDLGIDVWRGLTKRNYSNLDAAIFFKAQL